MKDLDLEYKIIGKGKSVLVIEIGIGSSFYDWSSIVQELIEDFTIVLYHRPGYGKSRPANTSRTTKNIAEELNYLVEKIEIKDRFILMGHSFGGLCVQQYAKMYPYKLINTQMLDKITFGCLFLIHF